MSATASKRRKVGRGRLDNAALAELLARSAETTEGIRQRAFRRAARSAFLWPEEAADLLATGRALTELRGVGPFLARQIETWLTEPPEAVTPPPLRRDFLTRAEARRILATKPDWAKRLRGDLQMHTRWSDGSGTIAEMAEAAEARGYEFIAITDHSKGLKIAGGIDETQLAEQGAEIDAWNASHRGGRLRVLRSIELNLNPRGEGDMTVKSLAELDLVLGSFHSALRKKEDQTARYLAALAHPQVQILGHPRGRIYNFRQGLSADWPRILAEAAKRGKALEIDCYPDRQDLNLALLKRAREAGAYISLGTDAHHPWQLEFIELGLAAALKARVPPERIINFMPLEKLRQWAGGRAANP
jgi:histidinol phosphatase-like PHP family hydrolase